MKRVILLASIALMLSPLKAYSDFEPPVSSTFGEVLATGKHHLQYLTLNGRI